jgi:site-specific recombinase XerC
MKGQRMAGMAGTEWTQERLLEQLEQWRCFLQEQDRSLGTVEKYVEVVLKFLAWYEQEEGGGGGDGGAHPTALIGYRYYLQHEQQKSASTINLRVSALRAWCGWLVDAGYLTSDPSSR